MVKQNWLSVSLLLTMVLAITAGLPVMAAPEPAADMPLETSGIDTATETLASQADAIALVNITHVSNLINPAMSFPGVLSVEAFSYQLSVSRLWKGEAVQNGELQISLSDCSKKLEKGESYLIFGSKTDDQWTVSSCRQVIPATEANQQITQLDRLYKSSAASFGKVARLSPSLSR